MSNLRVAHPMERAVVGHAINLAHSAFTQKFGSVAKFGALPLDEKMAYVSILNKTEKLAAEREPPSHLGFGLYKKWVVAVALRDEKLAKQFSTGLAEISRTGDLLFGPSSLVREHEERPAGYDEMTEAQRALSARFIREEKERQMRTATANQDAASLVAGQLEKAQSAHKRGDYVRALRLLLPLAYRGNPSAQFNLGIMYANGQGIQEYLDQVVASSRAFAADGVHVQARYRDACKPEDYVVRAYQWFSLAASGFAEADSAKRMTAVQYRDWIATKMTSAQIAEAKKRTHEWKPPW